MNSRPRNPRDGDHPAGLVDGSDPAVSAGGGKGDAEDADDEALRDELRLVEIRAMKEHVLDCPGLDERNPAVKSSLRALRRAEKLLVSGEGCDISDFVVATSSSSSSSPRGIDEVAEGKADGKGGDRRREHRGLDFSDDDVHPETAACSSSEKSGDGSGSLPRKTLRCLLLDIPLAVLFSLFLIAFSFRFLHDKYFVPLLDANLWTYDEKGIDEITYYFRRCDESDISATAPIDLVVPPESTPREAHEHMLKHGMSVYPNVVTPEAAKVMRDWVLKRNAQLTEDDSIPLIANEHRWSFRIGAVDDPSVPPVLKQIASHPSFRPAVDEIMGPNAAMVELTAITSAYGAADQHWHSDNAHEDGPINYARSFVPMYSLFVPLQDTTAAMGSTEICPGSHYCSYDMGEPCAEHGFRVDNTRNETLPGGKRAPWRAGDGFLFNLQSWHRGPSHDEPGEDTVRVMLILTLSPRPKTKDGWDRRQISLGTSYSTRWDMWGFTLDDLLNPHPYMSQPWATLRTLGLWSRDAPDWGWDSATVASSQIANEQMGYTSDEMEWLLKYTKGRMGKVLFGIDYHDGFDIFEEGIEWRGLVITTINRMLVLTGAINAAILVIYLIACAIVGLWRRDDGLLGRAVRRVKITHGLLVVATYLLLAHAATKPWSKDVLSGKLFESPFVDPLPLELDDPGVGSPPDAALLFGPTTLPTKRDVLVGIRYDDPSLNSHNLWLDHHPGNLLWRDRIASVSNAHRSYSNLPPAFRDAIVRSVVDAVFETDGRFLLQDERGDWMEIEDQPRFASEQTRRRLLASGNEAINVLWTSIRGGYADCRYGRLWNTAWNRRHRPRLLRRFERELFSSPREEGGRGDGDAALPAPARRPGRADDDGLRRRGGSNSFFLRPAATASLASTSATDRRRPLRSRRSSWPPPPPSDDAIRFGDDVEVLYDEGWFQGIIKRIHEDDDAAPLYDISFEDGGDDFGVPRTQIRKSQFRPRKEGDRVQANYHEEDNWFPGRVTRVWATDRYDIEYDDGDFEAGVRMWNVRGMN